MNSQALIRQAFGASYRLEYRILDFLKQRPKYRVLQEQIVLATPETDRRALVARISSQLAGDPEWSDE